jgi:hypothetical protein
MLLMILYNLMYFFILLFQLFKDEISIFDMLFKNFRQLTV